MLKVSTFIYSEDSISENSPQGNRLHVVNPQNVFRPMFIPSLFSFCVTFGVVGLETAKDHTLRYLFWEPNNTEKPIIDSGVIPLPKNDNEVNDLPVEAQGLMLNMNFRNVPFKKEGYYTSDLYIDEEKLGSFPIYVKGNEVI